VGENINVDGRCVDDYKFTKSYSFPSSPPFSFHAFSSLPSINTLALSQSSHPFSPLTSCPQTFSESACTPWSTSLPYVPLQALDASLHLLLHAPVHAPLRELQLADLEYCVSISPRLMDPMETQPEDFKVSSMSEIA